MNHLADLGKLHWNHKSVSTLAPERRKVLLCPRIRLQIETKKHVNGTRIEHYVKLVIRDHPLASQSF